MHLSPLGIYPTKFQGHSYTYKHVFPTGSYTYGSNLALREQSCTVKARYTTLK